MTKRDRKLAAVVSLLVTASVALNMLVFQNIGTKGSAIETGGITDWTALVDGLSVFLRSISPGSDIAQRSADGGLPLGPLGESGDANRAETTKGVQRELNNINYGPGPADGVLGLVTRAAIFAYEYDNGLVLTSKPSDQLLSQLIFGSSSMMQNSACPSKTMTSDAESLISTVKKQLSALGYQPGMLGSALTPAFVRAISEFETDQKLKVSGRISGPLESRLLRLIE